MRSILLILVLAALPFAARAQLDRTESLAGEKAAERARRTDAAKYYNIDAGPVAMSLLASLRGEYNDNVFYTEVNPRDDFIIRPELRVTALWPLTELNALNLTLGVGYEYHTQRTELNADSPLISPDSTLELLVFAGDFRFRFFERFSYQESLYYYGAVARETGDFISITNNIGKFGRLQNDAGLQTDWDLHKLVLTARYEHETFLTTEELLNYLDRTSEKFALSADLVSGREFHYGVETKASWNDYQQKTFADHWRVAAGPYGDVTLSPRLNFRVGAGYNASFLEPTPAQDSTTISDYYAYLRLRHRPNQYLDYGLTLGKEQQLGWSTAVQDVTYLTVYSTWSLIRYVDLSTYLSLGQGDQKGGTWSEQYTYIQPGLRAGWHFARRWTAILAYDFVHKNSDRRYYSYDQNRISLGAEFKF
jgi:hypothetical protein